MNKFNLTKTVSLNPKDDRYQLIYATELYSSLFAAYAKFDTSTNGDGTVKITQVEVVGINYKGPINLGIVLAEYDEFVNNTHTLKLIIQANDTGIWSKSTSITNLNIDVSDGHMLRVERKLLPMNNTITDPLEKRAFVQGKFDSEFFTRNGVFVKEKSTIPEAEFNGVIPLDIPGIAEFSSSDGPGTVLGASCEEGWAKFVTT